jgi:hypothetical protein
VQAGQLKPAGSFHLAAASRQGRVSDGLCTGNKAYDRMHGRTCEGCKGDAAIRWHAERQECTRRGCSRSSHTT